LIEVISELDDTTIEPVPERLPLGAYWRIADQLARAGEREACNAVMGLANNMKEEDRAIHCNR
jgi:hypothetical protein